MPTSLDDIPKYIRYDFFMALLGILIIYFVIVTDRIYNNIVLLNLFLSVGIPSFLYGIYEMKKNYGKEKEIQYLKMEHEKERLKGKG